MFQYSAPLQYHQYPQGPALYALTNNSMSAQAGQQGSPLGSYDYVREHEILSPSNFYAPILPQPMSDSTSSIPSSSAPSPSPSASSARRSHGTLLKQTERRREQNRLSQRAFRDRKNTEIKRLRTQSVELEAKHQSLLDSHSSQSAELRKLRAQVEDLTRRIEELTNETVALQMDMSLTHLPSASDPWAAGLLTD